MKICKAVKEKRIHMIETVKVKQLAIGEGIPKICVPIVADTEENILAEAECAEESEADLIEWRADFWKFCNNAEKLEQLLVKLQKVLKTKPLLFTIRTKGEGGEFAGTAQEYQKLVSIASKTADIVDLEVFMNQVPAEIVIKQCHENLCKVVASNHEFYKTPQKEEIIRRLCYMQTIGADILKIAVMPENEKDVLTLLSATEEMVRKYAKKPVVTMAMNGVGAISRVSGEIFGSAITFGSMKKASAPGQLELSELKKVLEIIHNSKEK